MIGIGYRFLTSRSDRATPAHDAVRRTVHRAAGSHSVRIGGEQLRVSPGQFEFWATVSANRWEPDTLRMLDEHLGPDSVYCDIGPWIGPTVMFAARRCGRVYCFEPDLVAYGMLLANLRLNALENVVPFNVALAEESGLRKMASMGDRLGTP